MNGMEFSDQNKRHESLIDKTLAQDLSVSSMFKYHAPEHVIYIMRHGGGTFYNVADKHAITSV